RLLLKQQKANIPAGTFRPRVFVQPNGRAIRAWTLRRPWASACVAAKLGGKKFHDLRRTSARNLVRAGVPERVAQDMLGHKRRSIFDRYNITSAGDLRDAAAKLDAVTTAVTNAEEKVTK